VLRRKALPYLPSISDPLHPSIQRAVRAIGGENHLLPLLPLLRSALDPRPPQRLHVRSFFSFSLAARRTPHVAQRSWAHTRHSARRRARRSVRVRQGVALAPVRGRGAADEGGPAEYAPRLATCLRSEKARVRAVQRRPGARPRPGLRCFAQLRGVARPPKARDDAGSGSRTDCGGSGAASAGGAQCRAARRDGGSGASAIKTPSRRPAAQQQQMNGEPGRPWTDARVAGKRAARGLSSGVGATSRSKSFGMRAFRRASSYPETALTKTLRR
jgi:hypothetical protein